MPDPVPPTTRRAALAGLLGGLASVVAVTGCDVDDLRPPEARRAPSEPPDVDARDPDQVLVGELVDRTSELLLMVTSVRAHPRVGKRLEPLQRMHEAHLETLGGDEVGVGPGSSEGSVAHQYRQLRQREEALQERLAGASVEAGSGALARLLASMSAAVAQHLAVLPPTVDAQQDQR